MNKIRQTAFKSGTAMAALPHNLCNETGSPTDNAAVARENITGESAITDPCISFISGENS